MHAMMKDAATLVTEQGKQLDVMETNVDVTHDTVMAANKDLVKAEGYLNSYRRRCLCFFFVLAAVIAVVVAIVVTTLAPKK